MYLDTAATSPVRREVLEAMWPYLAGGEQGVFANPSSRHEPGRRAARALDEARERIAARLGCRPGEVVLTSGGTEADKRRYEVNAVRVLHFGHQLFDVG